MTDMLIAPEYESFPKRKRWTRKECYGLLEVGGLKGRWELIDGEILSKMGQKPPHSFVLNAICQWLIALFGFPHIRIQAPITIPGRAGKTNEPEPDIALTLEPYTAYSNRHPTPADLLLIVEVSDTSVRFDLTRKAMLYARAGVCEYWSADILGRQMHCHRKPTPNGYAEVTIYGENEPLTLPRQPNSTIRFIDLLPLP